MKFNLKFWPLGDKIKILFKNRNSGQNSKFWSKIPSLAKTIFVKDLPITDLEIDVIFFGFFFTEKNILNITFWQFVWFGSRPNYVYI